MSQYNSPILVVKKKDGNFRLVQDLRALNDKTYHDQYSMNDVNDCIHEIAISGYKILSSINLNSGFWQMVLKPYISVTYIPSSQYMVQEFKRSPMGLLGCPVSFQLLMVAALTVLTRMEVRTVIPLLY